MPTPAQTAASTPAIPFKIGSRKQTRQAFTPPTVTLSASASTAVSPIEIPATGYLSSVRLNISYTYVASTAVTYTADAPFNIISTIGVRSADGTPLITPMTGYQLYLINKYGAQTFTGRVADPKLGYGYVAPVATGTQTGNFFLSLPFQFDQEFGLGAIPALASNRSYIIDLTLSSSATVFASGTITSVTCSVTGFSEYWAQPAAANSLGQAQQTAPQALGTLARWQLETPVLTPGDKYIKSNNVGGTIRSHIMVLRNSSGARIDTNGWPSIFQLYLDNEPQFYFTQSYFQDLMSRVYGLDGSQSAKDGAGALDTGVYVLPYHSLLGGLAGDPANSRGQLLNTNSASLLQFYGSSFGSAVSTLEVITNTVSGPAAAVYSR